VTVYFISYKAPSSILEKADTQFAAGTIEAQVTIGVPDAERVESDQQLNVISVNEKLDRLRGIHELRTAERLSVSSWLEFA